MSGWIKHFYWYDNTWLDVYVKLFYTDNTSKLNSILIGSNFFSFLSSISSRPMTRLRQDKHNVYWNHKIKEKY